jgi:hypothetical protein
MKKGQRTTHEKAYFHSGLGGRQKGEWWRDTIDHQNAKNISRKKKKRKK